jgi:hypothetical protein
MMRTVKILVLIMILGAFGIHEYYVSIFRLTYSRTEKQIQGELKVFTDDLELLLKNNDYGVFALDDKSQKAAIERSLSEELPKHIKYFDIKNRPKKLSLVGFENEGDLTWVYFTIDDVKSVKEPALEIDWMLDMYSDQVNIVHFYDGIDERSEFLSQAKPKVKFIFSE